MTPTKKLGSAMRKPREKQVYELMIVSISSFVVLIYG
jgi:hypothetical protein